jgi:plastocyanin
MLLHRRAFAGLLAAIGVAGTTAASADPKTVEITIKQSPTMRFDPETVSVNVGDTVKWTNSGFIDHTVTFDPGAAQKADSAALPAGVAPFGSESMEQDATYSHTFTTKGTYKYFCKFHEAMGMVGSVIVS